MPFLFLGLVLLTGALSAEQVPQAGTGRGTDAAAAAPPTRPAARVSGRVVEDGTNVPVSGARVAVVAEGPPRVASSSGGPSLEAVADDDGRYLLDGLPPGRYRIAAQRAGFARPFFPDPLAFRTFEVAAGQTVTGVNLSLHKEATITGQILDPVSGEPLAGSLVMAMRRTFVAPAGPPRLMPAAQSVRTDDLGEFRIVGLPPGEYLVVASRPPNFVLATSSTSISVAPFPTEPPRPTLAMMTFYPGTADSSAAQTVTVSPGQVVTGIVIRILIVPTYQVSGTAVDERGAPIAGARVVLRFDPRTSALGGGPAGEGRSDGSGKFVIGGMPSGPYTAMASMPGQDASRRGVATSSIVLGRLPTSDQFEITVTDADVEGVQIVVQRLQ